MRAAAGLVALALSFGAAHAAAAPSEPAGRRDGSVGRAEDRTAHQDERRRQREQKKQERERALRRRVLIREVGLDEKKAAEVEVVLARYAKLRREAQRKQREQRLAVDRLLEADAQDEAAYERALGELLAAREALQKLNRGEIDEVSRLLTPKQRAKLLRVVQKLQRELRQRRRVRDAE